MFIQKIVINQNRFGNFFVKYPKRGHAQMKNPLIAERIW